MLIRICVDPFWSLATKLQSPCFYIGHKNNIFSFYSSVLFIFIACWLFENSFYVYLVYNTCFWPRCLFSRAGCLQSANLTPIVIEDMATRCHSEVWPICNTRKHRETTPTQERERESYGNKESGKVVVLTPLYHHNNNNNYLMCFQCHLPLIEIHYRNSWVGNFFLWIFQRMYYRLKICENESVWFFE